MKNTVKQQIISFMDNDSRSPRMNSMVKFINEKSDFRANVITKNSYHTGPTHSNGVRYGSGYETKHHTVTVTNPEGEIIFNEEIRPRDFTVWVYENIMNRKHWRYSGSTMSRGEVGSTFEEWDKQKIENERNDKTRD